MLWLILLTLHREVEIVLSVCSTSQENKNKVVRQKAHVGQHPVCGMDQTWMDWLLLQAVEFQGTPTSEALLAK